MQDSLLFTVRIYCSTENNKVDFFLLNSRYKLTKTVSKEIMIGLKSLRSFIRFYVTYLL